MPDIFKNWKVVLIAFTLFCTAQGLFYLWAFQRGADSVSSKVEKANTVAVGDNAAANENALATESDAKAARTEQHTVIRREIEDSHEDTDDMPAPDLDQRFYDRLRGQDRPAH